MALRVGSRLAGGSEHYLSDCIQLFVCPKDNSGIHTSVPPVAVLEKRLRRDYFSEKNAPKTGSCDGSPSSASHQRHTFRLIARTPISGWLMHPPAPRCAASPSTHQKKNPENSVF